MSAVATSQRVRVLEIAGNAIVGGMEKYVERLVASLPADRFEITCVCPFESPFAETLRTLGADVFITPVRDDPAWSSIVSTAALVRARRIDVMHAHLSNAHVLASLVSGLTRVPVLVTIHGRTLPLIDIEAYRLHRSRFSVVCQNALLHALSLGVSEADVELIPNGVDTARFIVKSGDAWLQRKLQLAPEVPLVGFVGRLSPEKAPARFLQMAAQLHTSHPELHFAMVGTGPLRAALAARAARMHLQEHVHFTGALDDMPRVYSNLQLLVMTSESEGRPLALMEAMAAGLPVVAPDVGGIAEIIVHGHSGILVPPHDTDALVYAVQELLDDSGRATRLGQAARKRACEHFAQSISFEAMARLLQHVASATDLPQVPANEVQSIKSLRRRT
jgi:glycosyltransferase involved in cell wall biosynthesis